MGNHCADHVTPLYPQKKLALTSPTGGGRSVGIVRSRTKATEFSLVLAIFSVLLYVLNIIKVVQAEIITFVLSINYNMMPSTGLKFYCFLYYQSGPSAHLSTTRTKG